MFLLIRRLQVTNWTAANNWKYKRSCPEVSENVSKIVDTPAPKVLKMERPVEKIRMSKKLRMLKI